jgi:hypothetical protein
MDTTRNEVAEQGLFEASRHLRALRGLGFLLSQTGGKGPFDIQGLPLEELGTLIDVVSESAIEKVDEALDKVSMGPTA